MDIINALLIEFGFSAKRAEEQKQAIAQDIVNTNREAEKKAAETEKAASDPPDQTKNVDEAVNRSTKSRKVVTYLTEIIGTSFKEMTAEVGGMSEGIAAVQSRGLLIFALVLKIAKEIGKFVERIMRETAALSRTSRAFGESARELNAWKKAGETVGASADDIIDSIDSLNSQLLQFQIGASGSIVSYFNEMGIALKDENGALKTATKLLIDLSAWTQGKDPRVVAEWFNQMGLSKGMTTLLLQGPDKLKALLNEMNKLSGLDPAQAKRFEELQEAWARLLATLESVGRNFFDKLIPLFMGLIKGFELLSEKMEKIVDAFAKKLEWLLPLVVKGKPLLWPAVRSALNTLSPMISPLRVFDVLWLLDKVLGRSDLSAVGAAPGGGTGSSGRSAVGGRSSSSHGAGPAIYRRSSAGRQRDISSEEGPGPEPVSKGDRSALDPSIPSQTKSLEGRPYLGAAEAVNIAMANLGAEEHVDQSKLMRWFKDKGYRVDPVTAAWCAYYVGASLNAVGVRGTGSGLASSYRSWGIPAQGEVQKGDVIVTPSNFGSGHVGFATGRTNGPLVERVSGNYNDRVQFDWVDTRRGGISIRREDPRWKPNTTNPLNPENHAPLPGAPTAPKQVDEMVKTEAAKNSSTSDRSSKTESHIQKIEIDSTATDAAGIAKDLSREVSKRTSPTRPPKKEPESDPGYSLNWVY